MIKHFEMNTVGRDFVVGDIHGCFTKLQEALDNLLFDPTADRLFSVGDMVDRGPESLDFYDWLQQPWFHAVRGNHEQMVIDAVAEDNTHNGPICGNHFINGGAWLYGIPWVEAQCYAAICADLPLAIEIETQDGLVGVVHAEVPWDDWELFKSSYAGNEQMFEAMLMWSRKRITAGSRKPVNGVEKVYVGHTPLNDIYELGNVVYLDTGACFGGKMSVVQIN